MEASIPKSRINNPVDRAPVTNTLLGRASTIKRPDTNRPVGKAVGDASAKKTKKNRNRLEDRMPNNKTRSRITKAMVEALDISPVLLGKCHVDLVPSDGNCFFHVVARQLTNYGFNVIDTDSPTAKPQQVIRNKIARHIRTFYLKDDTGIWLLPDSNDKSKDIQLDSETYAVAIQLESWAGANEMRFIIEGALSDITDNRGLTIEVYERDTQGGFRYHFQFSQVIEGLTKDLTDIDDRLVLRFLYTEPLHYDSLVCEEQAMLNNNNNRGAQGSNSEWECSACTYKNAKNKKNCAVCKAALNKANLLINDEWGMSKKEKEEQLKELEKYDNSDEYQNLKLPLISSEVDQITAAEFGFTPRTAANQIKALQQIEQQHGPKFVNIVEDKAYLSLVEKCLNDPFMIMGYQNGYPNLHYESTWEKEEGKENTFIGRIYIPIEDDLNKRKYTRYPNPLMSNTDGKTIVNLSLHNWAFGLHYWHDNNNKKNSVNQIDINIKMSDTLGVSEVESTVDDAGFFSISKTQKSIPYIVHDSSYSPDTGVLALDGYKCACEIKIENGPILALVFYRDKDDYVRNSKIGGTRKRRRQTKRRQSKRRQTKRR